MENTNLRDDTASPIVRADRSERQQERDGRLFVINPRRPDLTVAAGDLGLHAEHKLASHEG